MYFSLLKKIKIRDAMKKGVITVGVDAPLKEVISLLTQNNVSGVVVVDEFGEMWGVVSEIDIISSLHAKTAEEIEDLTAEDVMTPQAIQIDPGASLEEAARIMADKTIHRLVIGHPHEGRRVPVGIVTATDIIKHLQKELQNE